MCSFCYSEFVQRFAKKITPLFDRILVEKSQPMRTTASGIVLPESAVARLNEGRVIAVGKGKRTAEGKFIPVSLNVGDLVMLGEYGGNEVKLNGKDYLLIREEEVLGIVEETTTPLKSGSADNTVPNVKDLPGL